MNQGDDIRAGGTAFDFDRVFATVPSASDTVRSIEAAVAAGDLIRRVRIRKGMSQVTLAKRAGTTQPHLSDIERGLGENGPSVGTLSRLLRELGDELIVQSRKEQALWMAERIDAAEAAVGELAEMIARNGVTDMAAVMAELSKVNEAERENPFKNTLLNGLILGIYMTLRAQPESLVSADQKAVSLQIIKDMADKRFSAIFQGKSSTT
jgi:transcriptional regulator with XRE-family HTH domain